MALASMAGHRRAGHAPGMVRVLVDRLVEWRPEARPAGAAIELGRGRKGVKITAGAGENAFPLLMQKRAGERALGPFLAQDRVLIGRQSRAPVGVGADDVGVLGSRAPERQEICARNRGQAAQSRSTRQHASTSLILADLRESSLLATLYVRKRDRLQDEFKIL